MVKMIACRWGAGSAHSLAQCCPGPNIPGLELGDMSLRTSWGTVGGSGASPGEALGLRGPWSEGSQGLGHPEQVG